MKRMLLMTCGALLLGAFAGFWMSDRRERAVPQAIVEVAPAHEAPAPPPAGDPSLSDSEMRELARLRRSSVELAAAVRTLSNEVTALRAENARFRALLPAEAARPASTESHPGLFAIGPVRVGMTRQEALRELGEPSAIRGPTKAGKEAFVYTNMGLVLVVNSNQVVEGAQCHTTFTGRTAEGFGIGSAASALVSTLGAPAAQWLDPNGSTSYVYPQRGQRFIADASGNITRIHIGLPEVLEETINARRQPGSVIQGTPE